MHELALADGIVRTVADRLRPERVVRVRVVVGALAAVVPEALRFSFEVCARGTTLEGAALEIREEPARGRCRSCGAPDVELVDVVALCGCGSADVEWTSGQSIRIEEVEVD